MELLLGLVVFGALGAITIYGYMQSERAARERARGRQPHDERMAMVSGSGEGR